MTQQKEEGLKRERKRALKIDEAATKRIFNNALAGNNYMSDGSDNEKR